MTILVHNTSQPCKFTLLPAIEQHATYYVLKHSFSDVQFYIAFKIFGPK